ncbi:hypothetical protein [Urbifossiella limnaea]|uniref:Alginate biosynthesis protein AlgF n=1 Tax=Urbifossiella limnaea TaxID=2528023 RepID=A0A517XKV8_9BACT|nr:hypothetical protein [Urbifossiella limnaea]QDU18134.1 hypothetical protein ETAA1_00170 [Urbifossiella limnaea]
MRYRFAAAAAALSCVLVGPAQVGPAQVGPAKRYVSKEGGFAVVFPGGGPVKSKTTDTPGGPRSSTVGTESHGKAYKVTYAELSPQVFNGRTPDLIYLDLLSGAGFELNQQKVIPGKNENTGREVVIEKDGKFTRTQMFLSGSKLYILFAGGDKTAVLGKDGQGFFKSFEITPPAKPKAGNDAPPGGEG